MHNKDGLIERTWKIINNAFTNQGFRKYFANTSWLLAEQILRIIAGLLVGMYVARYLGPEKFGLFSYALAFVALFSSIAKLGMDGIVVRDLVNAPEKRDIYLGTAFWMKVVGAFIALTGMAVVLGITESDATVILYTGIIACGLIFQSFEVVDFYFQSRVLSKYVSICKIIQLTLSSLLKLYFIAISADLFWFVLVSLIDQASLAATLSYAYSKQKLGTFYTLFDKGVAKELLLNAKPLITSGIMVSVYSSVDRVIIKEMLGVREVGLYVAASSLVSALYFAPYMIANSLFPAILHAKRQSADLYSRRLFLLYRYSILFGLIVSIFVTIFAGPIITLFYGAKYEDSSSVLQIYIWNFLLICFSATFGKWLLAENLQKLLPQFTLLAMTINLLGCWMLIPLWSIKGAALAALASQLIPVLWFGLTNSPMRDQLKCVFKIKY